MSMLPADIHRRLEVPPVRPRKVEWVRDLLHSRDLFYALWPDGTSAEITEKQYAMWAPASDVARLYTQRWER